MSENRIGSERTRLRISQVELAKEIGISNKTLSSWESNSRKCPPGMLVKLAEKFRCSTDYLLGVTPDRMPRATA